MLHVHAEKLGVAGLGTRLRPQALSGSQLCGGSGLSGVAGGGGGGANGAFAPSFLKSWLRPWVWFTRLVHYQLAGAGLRDTEERASPSFSRGLDSAQLSQPLLAQKATPPTFPSDWGVWLARLFQPLDKERKPSERCTA